MNLLMRPCRVVVAEACHCNSSLEKIWIAKQKCMVKFKIAHLSTQPMQIASECNLFCVRTG